MDYKFLSPKELLEEYENQHMWKKRVIKFYIADFTNFKTTFGHKN